MAKVKMQVTLLEEELAMVEVWADQRATDLSSEVRAALALRGYLDEIRSTGGKVIVEGSDGVSYLLVPPAQS